MILTSVIWDTVTRTILYASITSGQLDLDMLLFSFSCCLSIYVSLLRSLLRSILFTSVKKQQLHQTACQTIEDQWWRTKSLINEKKEHSWDFRLTKQIFFFLRPLLVFLSFPFCSSLSCLPPVRINHRETISDDLNERKLLLGLLEVDIGDWNSV